MAHEIVLIMIGTGLLVVLPMVLLTWYSLEEDAHSPAVFRDESSGS